MNLAVNINSLSHIIHYLALENKLSSYKIVEDLYRNGFIKLEVKQALLRRL